MFTEVPIRAGAVVRFGFDSEKTENNSVLVHQHFLTFVKLPNVWLILISTAGVFFYNALLKLEETSVLYNSGLIEWSA